MKALKIARMALIAVALFVPAVSHAQTFPLTQAQIAEALQLYEIVGQKTKELFNDPAQKRQLSETLTVTEVQNPMNGLAGQAMQQAHGMIMDQLHEALSAALPPQVQMGIGFLQQAMGIMGVDNPMNDLDKALMAQYMPEETQEIKIDYERSNLPPAMKDMMQAMEKSSFDLGSLSAANNYILAGHWQRTGRTPFSDAVLTDLIPQDKTPRGLMALAVNLAQISYDSRDEVAPAMPDTNALLAHAARDTAPYHAQIEHILKLMQER